jgi:copper homeostasis protein
MRKIIFEICAETIDACVAAKEGGADRIELCSALSEGGLTPSSGLVRVALELTDLPLHVLVRPRGGDFSYSSAEVAVMRDDILHFKKLGAAGVVIGLLRGDNTVDVDETRTLVELAGPMKVTFHRAFDVTPSLPAAMEDVIKAGCDRLLTSGGERDVLSGARSLAALVQQAENRVEVAVGGGLRIENAATMAKLTGAEHFHGSLRRRVDRAAQMLPEGEDHAVWAAAGARYAVDAETVRMMVERLRQS